MIGLIIKAIKEFEYDESGEAMKVAKGKYKMPSNWKEVMRQVKRRIEDGRH